MKACPFCEAELRDSVIRCTRCLRSLDEEADLEREPGTAAPEPFPSAAPEPEPFRSAPTGLAPSAIAGGATAAPIADQWPAPDAWAIAPSRAPSQSAGPAMDLGARRALPAERRQGGRPDLVLLLASVVAAAAAYLAWRAVADPWVELVITDTSERLDPVLVGELTLRGRSALVGTFGHALAGGLGTLGAMWLFYGFDRGSTMPWFVSPGFALVAAVGGIGASILSSSVWFVWKDAAVGRSRGVGLSPESLRELLDLQPPPLVEIHRLAGLTRFGAMMLVGLLAASAAWWSYRRRA